jgi:transposase
MSDMEISRPSRRPRRAFTAEFRAGAVRLALDEGQPIHRLARQLDLGPTTLGEWVKRARADRTHGRSGLTTAERQELAELRKPYRAVQEERDILKKALAFFAKVNR